MTHKQAIEGVRRLVQSLGGKCYVNGQSQRIHGSAGIPDLICFANDRGGRWHHFYVEVKAGRDRLSPAQRIFKNDAGKAGVLVIVGTAINVAGYLGLTEGTEEKP